MALISACRCALPSLRAAWASLARLSAKACRCASGRAADSDITTAPSVSMTADSGMATVDTVNVDS